MRMPKGNSPGRLPCLALAATAFAGIVAAADIRGIAVEETLASESIVLTALDAARLPSPVSAPLWVRLELHRADVEPTPGVFDFARLEARVGACGAKGVRIWIVLADEPPVADDIASWREYVGSVAKQLTGRVGLYEIAMRDAARSDAKRAAFALKSAAVQIRAADPDPGILVRVDAPDLEALYAEGLAPYSDGIVVPQWSEELHQRMKRRDPLGAMIIAGERLESDPTPRAPATFLRCYVENLARGVRLTAFIGTVDDVVAALMTARRFSDLTGGDVELLDAAAAELNVGGAIDATVLPFYSLDTQTTYLAYWGPSDSISDLTVTLRIPQPSEAWIDDPLAAAPKRLGDLSYDSATGTITARLPLAAAPRVVMFGAPEEAPGSRTDVIADALPTVEEIIFRHQQAQAGQDAALENYRARATVEIHFRPAGADGGFDVVTENSFYYDRSGSEWEELTFNFNGAKLGDKRPPFPLLQPEKVLSLPLDLRLTRDYAYRLDGVDTTGGRLCYVVHFDPIDSEKSLYRGRVWIDAETYVKLKVQAVQTKLTSTVVSNEEIQTFEKVGESGGRGIYVLSRLESQQLFLMAGRNLLVERKIGWSDFRLNGGDFDEARQSARVSSHIMLKDTDQGLRYFVKQGEERVVSDRLTSSAKAIAFGLMYDPTWSFPVPIAGLNLLDFEFIGKNTQLAMLFGGVFAAGNIQRPKVGGGRLDVSLDFFVIGVPMMDTMYGDEGEIDGERLMTVPFALGLLAGYQLGDFQKLTVGYQFRYDNYFSTDDTDEDFVVPSDTITNGVGLGYEYRRRGYSFHVTVNHLRRMNWDAWGHKDDPVIGGGSYTIYSAVAGKDFHLDPLQKLHIDAAYYGGRNQDRFSSYQFGMFSEMRIHGVPSTGIRFSEIAMVRGSYSFNLFEQYRLDLFVDQGFGKSRLRAGEWLGLTGIGVAVNTRAPWNTFLRVDAGKSFLPDVYRDSGSYSFQVMFLKPIG